MPVEAPVGVPSQQANEPRLARPQLELAVPGDEPALRSHVNEIVVLRRLRGDVASVAGVGDPGPRGPKPQPALFCRSKKSIVASIADGVIQWPVFGSTASSPLGSNRYA